ncbi:MAG: hypothetical protein ACHQIG_13605 [Acidimicrobiia bacterium]
MGTRLRTVLVGALVSAVVVVGLAGPAGARSASGDRKIAKAGVLLSSDFPAGFAGKPSTAESDAAVAKLAKGIPACAQYTALKKATDQQPQAKSLEYEDSTRQVSNEVDVFPSAAAAGGALALYAKKSVPTCLDRLFTKLLTQTYAKDPQTKGKIAGIKVTITPQAVSGLGDNSVVYEGNAQITGKDGTTQQIGLGNAAVLAGRAVSDFTYVTTGAGLNEVLQPAVVASVARLRDALSRS